MAAMPKRWWIVVVLAAVLAVVTASPAPAKGTFKGTFGVEKFRSKRFAAACSYSRAVSLFLIAGGQGGRKRQKGASFAGTGSDPTAPGAVFPIVLSGTTGSFVSGSPPSPPLWIGFGDAVVVTLTGFRRGKVSGTVTGTLDPSVGATGGPIQVNATFAAKCLVQ